MMKTESKLMCVLKEFHRGPKLWKHKFRILTQLTQWHKLGHLKRGKLEKDN
jgi:hypothetical protein